MVENSKMFTRVKKWVKGSEGLQRLLEALIEEKTHLTLEELEPFTSTVYYGMLSHRLPCPALHRGALWNGCPKIVPWLRIVSDTATHYAKKGTNYNICFQEDVLYGLEVHGDVQRIVLPHTMALVLEQRCCIWELPSEAFTLRLLLIQMTALPQCYK